MVSHAKYLYGSVCLTLDGPVQVKLVFTQKARHDLVAKIGSEVAFEGDEYPGLGFVADSPNGHQPRVMVSLTSAQAQALLPYLRWQPGEVYESWRTDQPTGFVRYAREADGTLYIGLGERPGFELAFRPHERTALSKAMRLARDSAAVEVPVSVNEQGFQAQATVREVMFPYTARQFVLPLAGSSDFDDLLARLEGTALASGCVGCLPHPSTEELESEAAFIESLRALR